MLKSLAQWLQTHPVVVLLMFFMSLLSSLAGLLLGWSQLYHDYLSKSVQVPVWLALLALIVVPALIAVARARSMQADKPLREIAGKRFGVQQVQLDGCAFRRCDFDGTELVFSGGSAFSIEGCTFVSPRFSFSGPAGLALAVLAKFYSNEPFRPLIERTFDDIRAGALRSSPSVK